MTIEEYLDDLCKYLQGRILDEVADVRLLALDDRLQASSNAYQANGLSAQEAVNRAISDSGAPEVVGQALVREHLGYSTKSSWALSRWVSVVIFIALATPFAAPDSFGFRSLVLYEWSGPICGVVSWLSIALLGVWIWRTRRWLALPVAVFAIPLCLASLYCTLCIRFFADPPLTLTDISRIRSEGQDFLESEKPEAETVAAWRDGQPPTDEGPVRKPSRNFKYVPLLPAPWFSTSYSYSLHPMLPQDAELAWKRYGKAYATREDRITNMYRAMASSPSDLPPPNVGRILWGYTRGIAPLLTVGVGFLFAWNGLFLWLARLADNFRNRQFRSRVGIEPSQFAEGLG